MRSSRFPVAKLLAPVLPVGLLLSVCVLSNRGAGGDGASPKPMVAGFDGIQVAGRGGSYRGVRSSRAHEGDRPHLGIRLPSLDRAQVNEPGESEITVSKSNTYHDVDVDFRAGRERWKYLSKSVRRDIDSAPVRPNRWKVVIVHNSATRSGNARLFDYHHRHVKKMEDGLAYHFVIGNGSSSGDGEVEVGRRWIEQLDEGHWQDALRDGQVIGVCLVGDFNEVRVHKAQLEALDELVDYLQAKVGALELTTHREVNAGPASCPGRFFPEHLLR
jgi:hypothetical protein